MEDYRVKHVESNKNLILDEIKRTYKSRAGTETYRRKEKNKRAEEEEIPGYGVMIRGTDECRYGAAPITSVYFC